MPDDFLHPVQLLAVRFHSFSRDLSDAVEHCRDHEIRDAFKVHPIFVDDGMARHLTKDWGQRVTAEQVRIARTEPDRFRMVYDRAQSYQSDLRDRLSTVYTASKAVSPGAFERSLFPIIEAIRPLIDEPFDEKSLKDRAQAVKEWSAKLQAEFEAVSRRRSQIALDRTLPDETADDGPAAEIGPAPNDPVFNGQIGDFKSLLRDFRVAFSVFGDGQLFLVAQECEGEKATLPPEFDKQNDRFRFGIITNTGGIFYQKSAGNWIELVIWSLGNLRKQFDVFQLLAKRAGASLALSDVRRVGLRSRGSPEGTWVTFLLYWADTPEYVINRDGYRIVMNPFAASIHAIERAELDSTSPEVGYVEAGAVCELPSDIPKEQSAAAREKSRPSLRRNHFWLRIAREIGLETANVFGKVRDRWNGLTEGERAEYKPFNGKVAKGKPGWETVRKGIESALKDESSKSES